MKRRVTINEIAQKSQTSKTTVSRVLTGKGYVSKTVAKRIQDVAKELGYVPRHKSSQNIQDMVMVISCQLESEAQVVLSNAIRKRLYEYGIKTVIAPVEFGSDAIYDYLSYANEKKFGGIISLGALDTPLFRKRLQSLGCPIVLLNQTIEDLDVDSVTMKDYQSAYEATKYLLDCGHRRILYVTGYESATAIEDRERGFYDAMSDFGILYQDISIVYTDFSQESSLALVSEIIRSDHSISAILSSTDVITRGLLHAFEQLNIRVPDDMSIISFGDTGHSVFDRHGISVIEYDFDAIGRSMADLLLRRKGYNHDATIETEFDAKLVLRDSVKNRID